MTRRAQILAGGIVAVIGIGAGVAAWGGARDRVPDEPAAVLPSGERLSPVRAREGIKAPADGGIDLLDRIDLRQDVVSGAWGFQGPALCTSASPWGRLQLPCAPPEEYDLRISATRKHGADSLDIGFARGGFQGILRMDGNGGQASWIDLSTHRGAASNPTTVPGKRLRWNRATSIQISVRKEQVSLVVDGQRLMEWKGDPSDLRLPPEFRVPHRSSLFIGSDRSLFRLDELTLVPVSGTPRFLR